MLETRDLTMRVGGRLAVDGISCSFRPGTLTVLVGAAGAGKTSLLDLISGQRHASAGAVLLHGADITREAVARRAQRGLGRGFQRPQPFAQLSVVENVRLAVQARRSEGARFWTLVGDHRNTLERAHALVERVRLGEHTDAVAGGLSLLDARRLEFAMLMAQQPAVYLLDEPTGGLAVDERPAIHALIEELRNQREKIIVLAERHLGLVRRLADRAIVLHEGRLAAEGSPSQVMAVPLVRQLESADRAP